ncbi:MAG TPA: hypothetical protein VJ044_19135 [Candidatus Hodarchaeales archaeon]|nr:hypothetical protein [Candidatus Hodarchaeales archaeon]
MKEVSTLKKRYRIKPKPIALTNFAQIQIVIQQRKVSQDLYDQGRLSLE